MKTGRIHEKVAVEHAERLLNEDIAAWPAPKGVQPVLYVAFAFDPIICPPNMNDPRQYKAGNCLGAFMTIKAAKTAVENSRPTGGYVWDQPYAEDDPTAFLRDGGCCTGYVEEVPLERRQEGDRRHV